MSADAEMTDSNERVRYQAKQLEMIKGCVSSGSTVPLACEAAGIRWSTAKHWLEKNADGSFKDPVFAEAIRQAKALRKVVARLCILGAAQRGDWRAAAWIHDKDELSEAARNAANAARDQQQDGTEPDELEEERVVLLYPVPMPLGADISQLQMLPGHGIDRTQSEQEPDDDD